MWSRFGVQINRVCQYFKRLVGLFIDTERYSDQNVFSPTAIVSQLSGRDAPRPTMTGASGYASFEFVNTGQIHYQVITDQSHYFSKPVGY